jgi:uncharacterized membrane protein (DUF485 family)
MEQIIDQQNAENQTEEKIKKTASVFATVIQIGLFLVFATLKLTGVIDWSWWWVGIPLLPLLWQIAVLVALTFTSIVILSIVKLFMKIKGKLKSSK